MKKIIYLLIGICFFVFPYIINGEEQHFEKGEVIPNVYIKEVQPSGWYTVHQATTFKKIGNNEIVYCLDHFKNIDKTAYYTKYQEDYEKALNVTSKQWERINLLAYYGYNYENHHDIKWFIVTQMMIWQTISPQNQVYFTDYVNGNKINIYEKEINEIENLLKDHSVKPSFDDSLHVVDTLDEIILIDNNNVLKKFEIENNKDLEITQLNNKIIVKPKKIGKFELKLAKKEWYSEKTNIYISNNSQNVLEPGNPNKIIATVNFEIIKTHQFKIIKTGHIIDYKNIKLKEIPLSGVEYELFNKTTNEKTIMITNEKGIVEYPEIRNGEYCFYETKTLPGYEIDKQEYCFVLDDDINEKEYHLTNKLKHTKLFFNKIDKKTKEYLSNAIIGIYDINDKLIYKLKTIDKPYEFYLLKGKYYYQEIKSPDNYQINAEKIYFEVNDEEIINLQLENSKIITMPNTGIEENNSFIIAVGIIGLFIVIIRKRKIRIILAIILTMFLVIIFNTEKNSVINALVNNENNKKIDTFKINYDYIEIPSLNIRKKIKKGTTDYILKDYVGILDNGFDFMVGNLVLAGHNDKNTFGHLKKISKSDLIKIYKDNIEYQYRVIEKKVVKKDDIEHLKNSLNKNIITLITCINNNQDRLLVIGEMC